MAGLEAAWTAGQTRAQFWAIARLRWRIMSNSFRRKGGAGEMVGRIILFLVLGAFAFGMMAFAGSMAFLAAHYGRLNLLDLVLWGVFVLCQLLNIQLGQPGTVFDPTQLIRFPMRVGSYVAIRLFFGLLTPANVIGALMSLTIAVGVGLAMPDLWGYALVGMTVFAVTNALFSRMAFAWIDRWLSTRRAREVFTGLIFLVSMGIQWANFSFNPAYGHHHSSGAPLQGIHTALQFYHRVESITGPFPPELIRSALVSAHRGSVTGFLEFTAGCGMCAVLFFAVFAWRMSIEFRGENLSDAANAVSSKPMRVVAPAGMPVQAKVEAAAQPERGRFGLRDGVIAVLGKEILQVRRNTGIFYGMIAPIVFVFIFAGKLATRTSASWIFPAAIAYTLMGIAPLSFNSFGLEGAGAQFYFMAPTRMRDVFLAKNLINFGLALVEVAAVFAIISYVAVPPSGAVIASSFLWAASTLLVATTLGNRRSIVAPKKVDLGRTAGKQASPLSGLISLGVLLGAAAVGAGLLLPAIYFKVLWVMPIAMLAVAAGAVMVYVNGLRSIDRYTLEHRDEMLEELCKK